MGCLVYICSMNQLITIENDKSKLHIDNSLYLTSQNMSMYIDKDIMNNTVNFNGIELSREQVEMLVKFLTS